MAITFKSSADPTALLTHLGLSEDYILCKGYSLDLGISEMRLYSDTNLVATIKPGALLSSLQKLPSDHATLAQVKALIEMVEGELPDLTKEAVMVPHLGLCDAKWLESKHLAKAFAPTTEWVQEPVIPLSEIQPGPISDTSTPPVVPQEKPDEIIKSAPVFLRDATTLYQPVKGTSAEARYYVVGISTEGVKVAIKKPTTSISIRVESEHGLTSKVIKRLEKFGVMDKSGYASGHFHLHNTTPCRLVGALLMDMGCEWQTPMPNLDVLEIAA